MSLSFVFSICFVNTRALQSVKPIEITPRYVSSCDGGGKHLMKSIATCTMHDDKGNIIVRYGTASKCLQCDAMIFSQYYPKGVSPLVLGVYKYTKGAYQESAVHYMVYGYDGFYWDMAEDDFIKGFEWY